MYVDPVAMVAGLAAAGVAAASLVTALVTLAREVRTLRAAPLPAPAPLPRPSLADFSPALATGQHRAAAAGPRVLLVEDDETYARLLARLLRRHAIDVHIARDGVEARELAALWSYAVIVVDLGLPGEPGLDVHAAIRQRTILYSGSLPEQLEHVRVRALADRVLSKDEDVEAVVVELLGLPRA